MLEDRRNFGFKCCVTNNGKYSGQATWNPRRVAATAGVPHTYEELANANGTFYESQPPIPPHAQTDDNTVYTRPPNGGNASNLLEISPSLCLNAINLYLCSLHVHYSVVCKING